MSKDAIISVCSVQNNDEKEKIEIVSPGIFSKENDEFVAIYNETELSGLGNTVTKFCIGKDYFNMIRTGDMNTIMEFKNGKRASIHYNTPHGALAIKIKTNKVKIDVDETGGKVNVDYDVIVSKNEVINTRLEATIKIKD